MNVGLFARTSPAKQVTNCFTRNSTRQKKQAKEMGNESAESEPQPYNDEELLWSWLNWTEQHGVRERGMAEEIGQQQHPREL